MKLRRDLRFVITAILLLGTAIFLGARGQNEVHPARQALSEFPLEISGFAGESVAIPQDSLEVLGPGDFLLRRYTDPNRNRPPVNLFLAYFPSQRSGDTIHSPKNCLPGAGWAPVQARQTLLTLKGQAPFPVNRYVIAKGDERQVVLYWYWAHNRAVANEYWAKFYLIADSVRLNRSDGSLIRINTEVAAGETADAAERRLVDFAGNLVTLLNPFIPN